MALEDLTGTKYIDDLNSSNPAAGDNVSEGDDHIRGIKNVLKTTFPSIDGAITATDTELNYVDGVTSAVQTQLDAITANDWVTAARMADNSVDSDMYVDGSIDTAHFAAGSVDGPALATNSVNSAELIDGAVDLSHMSDNSVDSRCYVDGSIDNAHLAANSVDSAQYVDDSIDTAHYAAGSVDTTALGADCVTAAKIGNDVLDSEHYAAGSIDAEHISSEAVTTAKIAGGNVTVAKMASDSVDSAQYVDGSIDTAHIADLNVTGAKLALDHRSTGNADDVKVGNQYDYIWADADVGLRFITNNAEEMRLLDDGTLHVDGDVIAFSTTISDETLKYNINPVDFALDKIKQLKGVTFNYLKGNKASAGLLAQDVEKVMPSAVSERKLPLHTGDDKSYKTLHYDSMTAILVEAIKELTAKVEKLEKK